MEEVISKSYAEELKKQIEFYELETKRAARVNGELLVKVEDLENEIETLKAQVKQYKYESALSMSEVVRARRWAEALDEDKRKLLEQLHTMSIALRKAERWAQVIKPYEKYE